MRGKQCDFVFSKGESQNGNIDDDKLDPIDLFKASQWTFYPTIRL